MKCNKCSKEIKGEPVYCGICYINKMWEIDKLEEIKKIIDVIIKRSKLEDGNNPYDSKDYTHLF